VVAILAAGVEGPGEALPETKGNIKAAFGHFRVKQVALGGH
jgi:hypothetical protein